jgi:hypothetical protein
LGAGSGSYDVSCARVRPHFEVSRRVAEIVKAGGPELGDEECRLGCALKISLTVTAVNFVKKT